MDRVLATENDGQALLRVCWDLDAYMAAHGGRWPAGWGEVEATRRTRNTGDVARTAVDEAKVDVDWGFDPARLGRPAGVAGRGFRAVWLRSDPECGNSWMDPDDWLVDDHARPTTTATAPS